MLNFLLIANVKGKLRLSQYFNHNSAALDKSCRPAQEVDIIRKCLSRKQTKCSFLEYKGYNLIYRYYGSLIFIVAAEKAENELAVFEFIHLYVEALNKYFENVSEHNLLLCSDRALMILQEMVVNGCIVETNINRILAPLRTLDKQTKWMQAT